MSPSKPSKDIKVQVPRHNSQRIGPGVTAHVESLAREQNIRVDVRQTAFDPSTALAQAIDSASEWNSLLMTARAERGPQWDIGTQQFLVDEDSDLHYDPSPLLEYQKEGQEENEQTKDRPSIPPPDFHSGSNTPQTRRNAPLPPSQNTIGFSPRHPGQFSSQGMPFPGMAPVPPAQFYGGGSAGNPNMQSPMRIGGMGMNVDGMGGMGGMGMGSPDVSRRMTRGMGMSEDSFGGMH